MEEITATEAARWLGKSEKTVRKWIHQGKLTARVVTSAGLRQYAISTQDVEALMDAEESSATSVIEARLTALEDRLTRIEAQLENLRGAGQPIVPRPQQVRSARIASQAQEIEELAPGLVSAKEFAIAHGINPGTAKSAYQTGRIPTQRGKWRGAGRNPIEVALDSTGRRVFHQVYQDRLTPAEGCELCADPEK